MRALRPLRSVIRGVLAVGLGASGLCCSILVSSDGLAGREATGEAGPPPITIEETGARLPDGDAVAPATDAGFDAACVGSQTDAKDCGVCGRDCLDGQCVAGACQPFTIVTGIDFPGTIALDDTHVYWAQWIPNTGMIQRASRSGGGVQSLTANQTGGTHQLALDGSTVFFSSGGSIKKIAKDGLGGESSVFPYESIEFVVLANAIYAAVPGSSSGNGSGSVWRGTKTGGGEQLLYYGLRRAESLAVANGNVFFGETAGPNLYKMPENGSSDAGVIGPAAARRLLADDTDLYWLEYGSPAVYRLSQAGGTKSTLGSASANAGESALAMDATHVYWAASNDNGELVRVNKTGGPVETLAKALANPTGIAVDRNMVCWSERTAGKISCIAK